MGHYICYNNRPLRKFNTFNIAKYSRNVDLKLTRFEMCYGTSPPSCFRKFTCCNYKPWRCSSSCRSPGETCKNEKICYLSLESRTGDKPRMQEYEVDLNKCGPMI